jgi:hypothetical protein
VDTKPSWTSLGVNRWFTSFSITLFNKFYLGNYFHITDFLYILYPSPHHHVQSSLLLTPTLVPINLWPWRVSGCLSCSIDSLVHWATSGYYGLQFPCSLFHYSEIYWAGHLWLMPVTLATQEAEIRRIIVHGNELHQPFCHSHGKSRDKLRERHQNTTILQMSMDLSSHFLDMFARQPPNPMFWYENEEILF